MSEQREKQLILVYSVVAVVVVYYAITFWIPHIRRAIGLQLEKARVLKAVEGEVQHDSFDIKELAEYKSKMERTKSTVPKKKSNIAPKFTLKLNEPPVHPTENKPPQLVSEGISKKSIAPGYHLPDYSGSVSNGSRVAAGSSLPQASTDGQVSLPGKRRSMVPSDNAAMETSTTNSGRSQFLGAFHENSIEAQLHRSIAQRNSDPFGVAQLNLNYNPEAELARTVQERELREQQDREYAQSLHRDQSAQLIAEQKQLDVQVLKCVEIFLNTADYTHTYSWIIL